MCISTKLMDERIEISLLLDYYGALLTEKQTYIMNLYYNEDFSLAEISEHTNTSRQAIYDLIKRCNKLLLDYELKLKVMQKNMQLANVKRNILIELEKLEENCDENQMKIVDCIKTQLIDNI